MTSKALIAVAITHIACSVSLQALGQQVLPQEKLVDKYCLGCHDAQKWKGGLALDSLDMHEVSADAKIWEKVVGKLRAGMMPPAGEPRPDRAGYDSIATYLETKLDAAAVAHPNPGRPSAVHRLNRAEYVNAIRDLLSVQVDGESLLPADESAAGFDDNGETLSVSAMLMERYLIAARQISRTAIADPTIRALATSFNAPQMSLQADRQSEELPFGSRGGMVVKYDFPVNGDYTLKIRLLRTKGIEGPRIIGLGQAHELDVRVDGKRVKLLTIGGEKDQTADEVEKSLEVQFAAQAGNRTVGVTFLNEELAPEGMQRPLEADFQLKGWGPRDDSMRPPGVESVTIDGPYHAQAAGSSPSRSRIFLCHPKDAKDEEPCAKRIIARLARLAYRRPVTAEDMEGLLQYYESGRHAHSGGTGFEEGIRMALQTILVTPDFLFRIERDPDGLVQAAHRISDLELASRLSFFLWSSIPDDELLRLAEAGRLNEPAVLQRQVRRMLVDARSKALVDNFFGQWLDLRSVQTHVVDTFAFPDFDDDLRAAFQTETDLLFASMLREDQSVLELLNADYTYVNERLARHYGIPNIYGSQFRRVKLTDENRWGLLGKGSILMVTSLPNRTSPVLRGKWVLENIIGSPPPPPPPNVPAFPEDNHTDFTKITTVRQRLEQHRKDPKCASCHAQMDPLGFAFDNFDGIGKWRNAEAEPILLSPEIPVFYKPIDPSGVFLGGVQFRGPKELRAILMQRPENFVRLVTEKLLTYGLGRGLDYYDAPAIRKVIRQAAADDYRWSSIIGAIVSSVPFQMRSLEAPAPPDKSVLKASTNPTMPASAN